MNPSEIRKLKMYYRLEYNPESGCFFVLQPFDKFPDNGYYIVAYSRNREDFEELTSLINSIYDHPTLEEVGGVVSSFCNIQDVNI